MTELLVVPSELERAAGRLQASADAVRSVVGSLAPPVGGRGRIPRHRPGGGPGVAMTHRLGSRPTAGAHSLAVRPGGPTRARRPPPGPGPTLHAVPRSGGWAPRFGRVANRDRAGRWLSTPPTRPDPAPTRRRPGPSSLSAGRAKI